MLIHDRFDVLILTKVRFLFEGHNAMIQGRKASLGFITHNFSNEKGESVNVLKKSWGTLHSKDLLFLFFALMRDKWENCPQNDTRDHQKLNQKKGLVNRKF